MAHKKLSKFRGRVKLSTFAAVVSALTLLMFHFPFFRFVVSNVESGINGMLITTSLVLIMLAANYLACYIVLYLLRWFGKAVLAASFILSSVSIFFINTYDVLIDDTMMGNVFNTDVGEATSYLCVAYIMYLLFFGIVPAVLVFLTRTDYGSIRRFFTNTGGSIAVVLVLALVNMSNWPWIDRNAPVIGSLLLPWSYTVNSFRYFNSVKERNRNEILLPDASVADSTREVTVLIIGESARRDHFSLYGYERETNPLLKEVKGLKWYNANSSATYTTASVKSILDYAQTDKLYELLPNYLYRTGVEVQWRSSNWGEPPLHIEKYMTMAALDSLYGPAGNDYDGNLLRGLKDDIASCTKEKMLIVLHTSTSHGPCYSKKYPPEFLKFTPVSNSVEMSKIPHEQIINSYDNSILYVDWLVNSVIGDIASLDGWSGTVIYLSDHGESLGENNLYMHGVPMSIAPKEQYEIPFIIWSSRPDRTFKDKELLSQYHVFHTVLHSLSIQSPVYDSDMDIIDK